MLSKLAKTIKNGFRGLGKKGYTLIEVAAVVAVTATLTAVVVPVAMDKIDEGKKSAARQDCQMIAAAIAGFYKDTGKWPAYSAATEDHFSVLRSGNDGGTPLVDTPTSANHDPKNALANFGGGPVDWLENQLVVDGPGSGTCGSQNNKYLVTHSLNWKGPYAETFTKRDPWGNNYLVLVYGMHTPTTGTNKHYGWIVSAGPNATLETDRRDNILGGDDIGFYMHAEEIGH